MLLYPVMVLLGANDVRVLQVESDGMVKAVSANGVPVKYVIFLDEGHGFVKNKNQVNGYAQILTWSFIDNSKKPSRRTAPL